MERFSVGRDCLIVFAICLLSAHSLWASTFRVIRDDETEQIIQELIAPVLRAADVHMENVDIYIVDHNSINAFTTVGNQIFIFKGLLLLSDQPDILLGVLAHEIAHIKLGHVAREQEKFAESLDPMSLAAGALLSGLGSILTRDPTLLSLPLAGASSNYLQYNRIQENAADGLAVALLHDAGYSTKGLQDALHHFAKIDKLYGQDIPTYYRSHPLSQDRLEDLKHSIQQRPQQYTRPITQQQLLAFKRANAKLFAYSSTPRETLTNFLGKQDSAARYARSIALMRSHQYDEALTILNALIEAEPDNPHFYEVRAQIHQSTLRDEEAMNDLKLADQLLSDKSSIIHTALIKQTLLSQTTSISELEQVTGMLKTHLYTHPESVIHHYLLAYAYDRLDKQGLSHLILAKTAWLLQQFNQAEKHLRIAHQYAAQEPDLEPQIETLRESIAKDKRKLSLM